MTVEKLNENDPLFCICFQGSEIALLCIGCQKEHNVFLEQFCFIKFSIKVVRYFPFFLLNICAT
jgi:hypothetical protein